MISVLWAFWSLILVSHPAFGESRSPLKTCLFEALENSNALKQSWESQKLKNLSWLTANPAAREEYEKLKEIWGGRYPVEIAAAIEHARPEMPPLAITFTSRDSLRDHFKKHGAQAGAKTAEEYEEKAVGFANRQSKSAFVIDREPDLFIKYDPVTHEFVVVTHGGRIVTYYVSNLNPIYTLNYALCQYVQGDKQRRDCARSAWARTKYLEPSFH